MVFTQECLSNCEVEDIIDKTCILNYNDEKYDKTKIYDTLLKNIEKMFISNNYNTSFLEQGNNIIYIYEELTISLTTSLNQRNDKNNSNYSTIDLGQCEIILKDIYNLSQNETLFMRKIDVTQPGMKIPKIEYDVYAKLNETCLFKLNVTYCSNSKIDISIPTSIMGNLDEFNSSSGYYNDLCYIASKSGTDIILKDRKEEFISNNKTLCQESCILSGYDNHTKKVKCTCDVVESSSSFVHMKINKTKLYKNFIDIKNIANIKLLVCYKKLFSIKGILNNYGSYSLMPIIISNYIIIVIFYSKNLFQNLKDEIKRISIAISNMQIIKAEEERQKNADKLKIIERVKEEIKNNNNNEHFRGNNSENKNKPNYKISKSRKKKNIKKLLFNNDINALNNNQIKIKRKKSQNKNKKIKLSMEKEKLLEKSRKILSFNDEEYNNLSYNLALKYDKRNYCQYYFSLLKTKHIFIFAFFNNNDYNSKIIKINLFLFSFTLYYTINTLFFSDHTMHKIYEDKGSFNFLYQLPQIIYSSLISAAFSIIIEKMALSQGVILDLKKNKENKMNKDLHIKEIALIKTIKIKFIVYFSLSSIFLLFFWYYISMFCAIYINTQIHLIKDTLISFALSLIYPFGIYLIPAIFRIPSLANKKKKRYYLYTFSKILQII